MPLSARFQLSFLILPVHRQAGPVVAHNRIEPLNCPWEAAKAPRDIGYHPCRLLHVSLMRPVGHLNVMNLQPLFSFYGGKIIQQRTGCCECRQLGRHPCLAVGFAQEQVPNSSGPAENPGRRFYLPPAGSRQYWSCRKCGTTWDVNGLQNSRRDLIEMDFEGLTHLLRRMDNKGLTTDVDGR